MSSSFSLSEYFEQGEAARRAFADAQGYAGWEIAPLYEDMASRRFFRLSKKDESAVLMHSLPDNHAQATIGHSLHDYIRLSQALRDRNIHAPEIFAVDEARGLLLMEDLGDEAIDDAHISCAIDLLIALREGFSQNTLSLPDYFSSHIHANHRRVVDWYVPSVLKRKIDDHTLPAYQAAWKKVEADLPPPLVGFVHADYARHNLRVMTEGCGVLDFQGAQWGPLAYDLVNLLEDGRCEMASDRKAAMKERYAAALSSRNRENFFQWYAVLSAQFHCRLAGQFIKLALMGGKPRYLTYLPLLQRYLHEELKNPLLAPVATFFKQNGISFEETIAPDKAFIRSDAS